MLMPEIGASTVMKTATSAPQTRPVYAATLGVPVITSTTAIRMADIAASATKATPRPRGPGTVTTWLTDG